MSVCTYVHMYVFYSPKYSYGSCIDLDSGSPVGNTFLMCTYVHAHVFIFTLYVLYICHVSKVLCVGCAVGALCSTVILLLCSNTLYFVSIYVHCMPIWKINAILFKESLYIRKHKNLNPELCVGSPCCTIH